MYTRRLYRNCGGTNRAAVLVSHTRRLCLNAVRLKTVAKENYNQNYGVSGWEEVIGSVLRIRENKDKKKKQKENKKGIRPCIGA